jgi:hypothetical protein
MAGDPTTDPSTGPDEFDNLLGIGRGEFGRTLETSVALGVVTQPPTGGPYPTVEFGVGRIPLLN